MDAALLAKGESTNADERGERRGEALSSRPKPQIERRTGVPNESIHQTRLSSGHPFKLDAGSAGWRGSGRGTEATGIRCFGETRSISQTDMWLGRQNSAR